MTSLALIPDPDIAHELLIQQELEAFQHATQHGHRIKAEKHLIVMNRLIGERSERQVARMERERGLR